MLRTINSSWDASATPQIAHMAATPFGVSQVGHRHGLRALVGCHPALGWMRAPPFEGLDRPSEALQRTQSPGEVRDVAPSVLLSTMTSGTLRRWNVPCTPLPTWDGKGARG